MPVVLQGKVAICVSDDSSVGCSIGKFQIPHSFDISDNTFCGFPVWPGWVLHELGQCQDHKCKVRLHYCGCVHQAPNYLLVQDVGAGACVILGLDQLHPSLHRGGDGCCIFEVKVHDDGADVG